MKTIKRVVKPFIKSLYSLFYKNIYYIVSFMNIKKKQYNKSDFEGSIQFLLKRGYQEIPFGTSDIPALNQDSLDLSFIIPIYNCSKFVGYCLDTIINQKTDYNYEIICINDGSKDNSLDVIVQYQKKYPNKIVVVDQPNTGASSARNRGIDLAKGKYLAFIDSDDYVEASYINTIMSEAMEHEADIVQTGFFRVTPEHQVIEKHPKPFARFDISEPEKYYKYVSGFIWAGVIRKNLFENLRFAEKYWYEDMMTRFLIARRAKKISILPDCLYNYTDYSQSLSSSIWSSRNIKCADQLFLATKMFEYGKDVLCLECNDLAYNVLIQEMGVATNIRIMSQPLKVRKQMFIYLSSYIQNLQCNIRLYDNKNEIIHKALIEGNFYLWNYYCLSNRWRT